MSFSTIQYLEREIHHIKKDHWEKKFKKVIMLSLIELYNTNN